MRAVVIGNAGDDDPGFLGEHLEDRGFELASRAREDRSALADAERSADLIVLLGSDWSVYDPALSSWVSAEVDLVRRAEGREIPILGVCYGAQLVARSVGLVVERAPRPEIGWLHVDSAAPGLVTPGPWFQYHFDRWVPRGEFPPIATSGVGPQAFWHGRTLALQFHPEVTPAIVGRWCEGSRLVLEENDIDLEVVRDETARFAEPARHACGRLVDAFLSYVTSMESLSVRADPSLPA